MRAVCFAACAVTLPFVSALAQSGAHSARLVGVVGDSLSAAPLRGAEVVVSGLARSVTTDSLGRFTIDSLTPGTYQVGVFHPLLENLGITLATQPFVVGADSAAVVSLGVPSVPTLVRRYCGAGVTADAPAVVAGRILEADTDIPVAGAKVSLAWADVTVTKEAGVTRTPHVRQVETDVSGFFRICGIPSSLSDATLQATRAGMSTPEAPVEIVNSLLFYQSLAFGPAGSAARAVGTVSGRVEGVDARPIVGARIEVLRSGVAAVSREDGSFTLGGVATGTQLLIARQLGFDVLRTPVNVTSREPTTVTLTLGRVVNVMDPVLVVARANYTLERSGFSSRKRSGNGYYFNREDIDRRQPNYITNMLVNIPEMTVVQARGGAVVQRRRRVIGGAPSCTRLYVDGFEWRNLGPGDLDAINPADVIGLEVYPGQVVPIQFRDPLDRGCVTLVVWTQMRGKKK
jgi:hypothetical protein